MKTFKKAGVAVIAAAVIGLGSVPPVIAQETAGSDAETAVSNIQAIPDTANLIIHKYFGAESAQRSDGTKQDIPEGNQPAEGIRFNVTRVGQENGGAIDLTTQDGWKAISGVALNEDGTLPSGFTELTGAENQRSEVTNQQGEINFQNLPAGLYLVREPANQTTTDGNVVVPGAPFLVTVPMTNADGTGWLSDVHVYPKNQTSDKPVKTVDIVDSNDKPGLQKNDKVAYTITANVPRNQQGVVDALTITDKLPAGLGDVSEENVEVSLSTGGGEGTPLSGGQFAVKTETIGVAPDDQQVVRIVVKPSAIDSLGAAGTASVSAKITAEVDAANPTDLANTAWLTASDLSNAGPGWDPEAPGEAGPQPGASTGDVKAKVTFADINITKKAAGGDQTLPDAVFEVRRCTAQGNDVSLVDDSPAIADFNGETSWTTGPEGKVTISGLSLTKVGTDNNVVNLQADKGDNYCLVETKAPKGYVKQLQPSVITGLDNATLTTLTENPGAKDVTIENAATNTDIISSLPLTGGKGIWAILGLGLLLIIGGLLYSRKQSDQN